MIRDTVRTTQTTQVIPAGRDRNHREARGNHKMSESKKRTITMTDRRPITIVEDDWDVIASATYDFEREFGGYGAIRVRRHADGRHIVYGHVTSPMSRDGKGTSSMIKAGYLLAPGEDVINAIKRVSEKIEETENLADYCIADLPAEQV